MKEKFRIQLGDLDIRVSKESPTMFDVVVGNSRTGLGVLMCSIEQEKPPYPFYKMTNLNSFVEGTHSIGHSNERLQLLMNNLHNQETDNF